MLCAKEDLSINMGVMVLINNNLFCNIGRIITDSDGNFSNETWNLCTENNNSWHLWAKWWPQFYKKLKQHIEAGEESDKALICGDWNLVLNPIVNTQNFRHINNPRAKNKVLKLMEIDNDTDIYG